MVWKTKPILIRSKRHSSADLRSSASCDSNMCYLQNQHDQRTERQNSWGPESSTSLTSPFVSPRKNSSSSPNTPSTENVFDFKGAPVHRARFTIGDEDQQQQ